jgi:hypothetical protein
MFDIKNPDTFLGGQNVHNLLIIGLGVANLVLLVKLLKK